MKAMIFGFVAIAIVAAAAWYGLNAYGFSSADLTASSSAVRID